MLGRVMRAHAVHRVALAELATVERHRLVQRRQLVQALVMMHGGRLVVQHGSVRVIIGEATGGQVGPRVLVMVRVRVRVRVLERVVVAWRCVIEEVMVVREGHCAASASAGAERHLVVVVVETVMVVGGRVRQQVVVARARVVAWPLLGRVGVVIVIAG